MKKITVIAALIGGFYFAQAQVGIGTPIPNKSSLLDVKATDKGVLIPRVELISTDSFSPITGDDKEEGLLIYNTKTAGTGDTAVEPGFYFWKNVGNVGHWERVTSTGDIDVVINNMDSDLESVLELLRKAYPSNNLDGTPTAAKAGGMVYTPADGGTPSKIEYIVYDAATETYKTEDVTAEFKDIVSSTESNTTVVTYKGEQYYLSETYVRSEAEMDPSKWTDVPTGAIKIEVIGALTQNFETFLNEFTITIDGDDYTFEEYIEYLTKQAKEEGETKIVLDKDGKVDFQIWDETAKTWNTLAADAFSKIVKANETLTTIMRSENDGAYTKLAVDPKGEDKVVYEFSDENGEKSYIDLAGDIKYVIEKNEDIYNTITNIISQGGNVYFGKINGGTEDVLFMRDTSVEPHVDTAIDISQTIINNITNNMTEENINIFKNKIGDTINVDNSTSVFTGDTYIKEGVTYYVYKSSHKAKVNGGTAVVEKITVDKDLSEIVSVTLKYGTGISASVTGLKLSGKEIEFYVGTGNSYTVLSPSDITADVVVEFASTEKPEGIE